MSISKINIPTDQEARINAYLKKTNQDLNTFIVEAMLEKMETDHYIEAYERASKGHRACSENHQPVSSF